MLAPFLLLLFSTASAAVVAYGTESRWGRFHHGVSFIIKARRLQWPLVATAVALCVVLLMMVVAGRRRAWWLIGLLPVLTLFAHRFLTRPDLRRQPVEDPPLVEPSAAATVLDPGDSVIGIHFAGRAIAFPFAQMYRAPAVLLRDREQRMILMWSPGANKATAFTIGRELHARDLDAVSFPADALLLYDGRLGTFINGVTGQTTAAQKPISFGDPLPVEKLSWGQWLARNPTSAVMDLPGGQKSSPEHYDATAHPSLASLAGGGVTLIFSPAPGAVVPADLPESPVNVVLGNTPVLLVRDPATARLRAFDRHVESDLTPRFAAFDDPKHADVVMIDPDSNTEWSAEGAAVTGPAETRGKKLAELPVETDLSAAAMGFWFPQLRRLSRSDLTAGVEVLPPPPATTQTGSAGTTRRHRRRRRQPAE